MTEFYFTAIISSSSSSSSYFIEIPIKDEDDTVAEN